MQLAYQADESLVKITEYPGQNGMDVELEIQYVQEHPSTEAMKKLQHDFEANRVHTDVTFYAYQNHRYRIIVRNDYYADVVAALLKHRLVKKAEWI